MIARLAWVEIWRLRGTIVLQVIGFAIAIMALRGSAILSINTQAGSVPGSACSDEIRELSGLDSSGRVQVGWTPRQAQALLQALHGGLHAEVMPSSLRIMSKSGPQQVGMAFVGPLFFDVVCVQRTNLAAHEVRGPLVDGGVLDRDLAKQIVGSLDLPVEGRVLRPGSFSRSFLGLQYQSDPQSAWIPAKYRWEQGAAFLDIDVDVVHILVRGTQGMPLEKMVQRADAAIRAQPTLFQRLERTRAGPTLQLDSWTADRVQMVALLLRIFAGALFLLMVVNLLTYHFGRLPQSQALAATLNALGVPPAALWKYAAIEPAAVAVGALILGLPLSVPAARLALAAATNSGDALSIGSSAGVDALTIGTVFALTGILVAARGWLLVRMRAPVKGRAQRFALRWIPRLLSLQVAVALVTLTLAAQAAIGLWKALPPPPNFPLDGLSVVDVTLPPELKAQENISLRWSSVWERYRPGSQYEMALGNGIAPFLPNVGRFGAARHGEKQVQGSFAFVTPNFFTVLGYALKDTVFEGGGRSDANGAKPMVISDAMAKALFDGRPPVGTLVRVKFDPNSNVGLSDSVAVVDGIFSDGVVGAKGVEGKFSLSQLSMQAPIPTAYMPMSRIDRSMRVVAFIRHPSKATASQIISAVSPAMDALLPGARISTVQSATAMYRAPLRKERAMATVLAIFAMATFCIGLLGMLALMQMLLHNLRTELAIRYAVGALPVEVLHRIGRHLLANVLVGVLVATPVSLGGLYLLSQALETTGHAALWGPALGFVLVLATCLYVAVQSVLKIRSVQWIDWLRCE